MANKIKLIVGLGNPGTEYDRTRHNVGFWLLDELAKIYSVNFSSGKFFGDEAKIIGKAQSIFLLKPTTFMNLSGKAVQSMANFYKIMPDEILIVHDELDLPCGTAKIKFGGGTGGHNGLSDIANKLGNNKNFYRLRLGISRPAHKNIVPYVLGAPNKDDLTKIQDSMQEALAVLPDVINGDIEKAMKQLHTKN